MANHMGSLCWIFYTRSLFLFTNAEKMHLVAMISRAWFFVDVLIEKSDLVLWLCACLTGLISRKINESWDSSNFLDDFPSNFLRDSKVP